MQSDTGDPFFIVLSPFAGFAIIKELTIDVENVIAKPKPPQVRSDKNSAAETSTLSSSFNDEIKDEAGKDEVSTVSASSEGKTKAETERHVVSASSMSSNDKNAAETGKHEVSIVSTSSNKAETQKLSGAGENAADDESAYAHSEDDSARSPHVSPRRSTLESLSPEFLSKQFGVHDLSPHAKESQRYAFFLYAA